MSIFTSEQPLQSAATLVAQGARVVSAVKKARCSLSSVTLVAEPRWLMVPGHGSSAVAAVAANDGGVDVDDDPWAEAAQTRRAGAADAMSALPGFGRVDSDVRVMGGAQRRAWRSQHPGGTAEAEDDARRHFGGDHQDDDHGNDSIRPPSMTTRPRPTVAPLFVDHHESSSTATGDETESMGHDQDPCQWNEWTGWVWNPPLAPQGRVGRSWTAEQHGAWNAWHWDQRAWRQDDDTAGTGWSGGTWYDNDDHGGTWSWSTTPSAGDGQPSRNTWRGAATTTRRST